MERKGDEGVGVSEVRSSGGQIVQRVLVSQQGLDFPHFFAPAVRELRHKKENCCTKIQNLRKKREIIIQENVSLTCSSPNLCF